MSIRRIPPCTTSYTPLKRVKFSDLRELASVAVSSAASTDVEVVTPAIILSCDPSLVKKATLVIPPIMIPTDEPTESIAPKVPKPAQHIPPKPAQQAPPQQAPPQQAPPQQVPPKHVLTQETRPEEYLTKKDMDLIQCTNWLAQMVHADPSSTAIRSMRKRGYHILTLFYAENESFMALLSAMSNEKARLHSVIQRTTREDSMIDAMSSHIAYLTHRLQTNWERIERYHAISQIFDVPL